MSFPESEKYSPSKQPKHLTMSPTPSGDSLYFGSSVALEQRRQSEAEMNMNDAASHQAEGQEGALGGIENQFNWMAPSGSISEFGNSVSSATQEKIVAAKDTLMEGALPAAQGAIRTVQGHIRTISGGSNEVEETVSQGMFLLP
ncbi:unnamed protein product [Penicillium egyptiacum]|uniref:Uncharacterized protein n=1 Tax=Penicillium egyptiacum TaxID=1303716 RepID=A0A9W4KQE7_9EURO|nr:unnamed protein product [Penicillium egyptiacum]